MLYYHICLSAQKERHGLSRSMWREDLLKVAAFLRHVGSQWPHRMFQRAPYILPNIWNHPIFIAVLEMGKENAGRQLYQAASQGNLVSMAAALAQGAEANWSYSEEQGRTPLIASAIGVMKLILLIYCWNDSFLFCVCLHVPVLVCRGPFWHVSTYCWMEPM